MNKALNNNHFLSLVVPAYKQERTIVSNVKRIKSVLDQIRYDYEIIVVIDGHADNSLNRLRSSRIPKTIYISYDLNQGKAYAIRIGMKYARGDYVMFLDSGNEIDPNGISMLMEHMEWYNADIIVGSKRHPASQVKYSPARRILSYGYFVLVKLLFRVSIKDTQAGIKIFKKKVLVKILPKLLEKKFAGDLEMIVVAKRCGFNRIYEAPIKLNYQLSHITSAATLKSILGMLIDTLAIYYRTYIQRYYDRRIKNRSASRKSYSIYRTR